MEKPVQSEKKVLIFGFDNLTGILALKTMLEPFGAELIPIGRGDYGKTLAALAGLEEEGSAESGTIPGRMAVLCGLDDQLDDVLAALRAAGAGPDCLKAVLTRHNCSWSASRLYLELSREHEALRAQQKQQT